MVATPDPLVGKQFRDYAILSCIGSGGRAKVYKARHVFLERFRAIKILRPDQATKEVKARFLREAQTLVHLKNRHIVSVFDFGLLGEYDFFMVMEYIDGGSLRDLLSNEGRLPVDEAIEIATQIAIGLSVLDKHRVVHRDICPENIMLIPGVGQQVKIIDFGIAKSLLAVADGPGTDPIKFIGKPEYISPEQINKRLDEELDTRTDIYALGVTLYEMLSGSRPFQAKNPQGILAQHLTKQPMPLAEANLGVTIPQELSDLVTSMLHKERNKRPTPGELLSKLNALRGSSPDERDQTVASS